MAAKSDLLERLKYIDSAIALPELIDSGVGSSEHNNIANLLRKGLSIVSFNILEDFIKNKCNEALLSLSSSNMPYVNLPESLQDSAIVKALTSLSFQLAFLKKDNPDYKLIIQEETRKIFSTSAHPYELSKYSLLSSGTNIGKSDIKDFLESFGITGGWAKLKLISDNIGGGIPDLAQAFNLAATRRHQSAHSANFNYNHTWLSNLKSEILSIASSIDILLTCRCRQARKKPLKKLECNDLDRDLNYRFLESHGIIYKETKSIGGKSIRNWPDIQSAFNHHSTKLERKNEFLIVLNPSRRIMDWLS